MTILAVDRFNRANGTLNTGNWTSTGESSGGSFSIASNVVSPADLGKDSGSLFSGTASITDQYAQGVLSVTGTVGGGCGMGVGVRMATSVNYYRLVGDHAASGNWELGKKVAGAYTAIWTGRTQAWSNGDTVYLQVVGTTLIGKIAGTAIGASATDSSLASGCPGVLYSDTTSAASIDSFIGGDMAALAVLQSTNAEVDGNLVATLTQDFYVTAGDAISVTAAAVRQFVAGDITDDASNTWLLDESSTAAATQGVGIWRCQSANATGFITITLNGSASGRSHMQSQSLRGLTASPLDVHTNNSGISGSVSSGTTGATAQADEWVVACATGGGSTITTPAGGGSGTYTSTAHLDSAANVWEASYLETVATGTQAATWTQAASGTFRAAIAAYLITAVITGPPPNLSGMNSSMQGNA